MVLGGGGRERIRVDRDERLRQLSLSPPPAQFKAYFTGTVFTLLPIRGPFFTPPSFSFFKILNFMKKYIITVYLFHLFDPFFFFTYIC